MAEQKMSTLWNCCVKVEHWKRFVSTPNSGGWMFSRIPVCCLNDGVFDWLVLFSAVILCSSDGLRLTAYCHLFAVVSQCFWSLLLSCEISLVRSTSAAPIALIAFNLWNNMLFRKSGAPQAMSPPVVRSCAEPPDHLRGEISFSRTCNIPNVKVKNNLHTFGQKHNNFEHIALPFRSYLK